jgi:transposase
VHVICDNSSTHKTPAIQRWLTAHPRFQLHFTPTYSSWLNLVERFIADQILDSIATYCQRINASGHEAVLSVVMATDAYGLRSGGRSVVHRSLSR